jgi:tetratricopeptide (TPR) repeat protein
MKTIKNTMRHLITFIGLLLFSQLATAQSYDDLRILYADGNYEKLVKEAESYTEKDDTKYDPVPYIWAAKGLYKISLSGTTDERFDNAYKDAIKFLGKGMKYDLKKNDGQAIEEFKEFIDEFQLTLYNRINNDLVAGDDRKAYSWASRYGKITQNEVGALLILGACKYEQKDRSTARAKWKEADELWPEITGVDSWSEADQKILMIGIIETAKAYKTMFMEDKAKEMMGKAGQWFEDDEEWQRRYDEYVNS